MPPFGNIQFARVHIRDFSKDRFDEKLFMMYKHNFFLFYHRCNDDDSVL